MVCIGDELRMEHSIFGENDGNYCQNTGKYVESSPSEHIGFSGLL